MIIIPIESCRYAPEGLKVGSKRIIKNLPLPQRGNTDYGQSSSMQECHHAYTRSGRMAPEGLKVGNKRISKIFPCPSGATPNKDDQQPTYDIHPTRLIIIPHRIIIISAG